MNSSKSLIDRLREVRDTLAQIPRSTEYSDMDKFWYDFNLWTSRKLSSLATLDNVIFQLGSSIEKLAVDEAKLYSDITEIAWKHADNEPVSMVDAIMDVIMDVIGPHLRITEPVSLEVAARAMNWKENEHSMEPPEDIEKRWKSYVLIARICAEVWGLKYVD